MCNPDVGAPIDRIDPWSENLNEGMTAERRCHFDKRCAEPVKYLVFVVKHRLFRAPGARVLVLLLVLAVVSCRDDPSLPTQGLSAGQIQFASFWPHEYVLDLRERNTEDAASRNQNRVGIRLGDGWSAPDRSGRWAQGETSTIVVHLADPAARNLLFEYRSPGVESIAVDVNGVDVGQLPSHATWHTHLLSVADGILRTGVNTVVLRYAAGPQGFPLFADGGWRSVYFRTVGVVKSEEAARPGDGVVAFSRDQETLTVGRSGTLVVPYRTDQQLASVAVTMSAESRLWRSSTFGLRYWGAADGDAETEPSGVQHSLRGLWGRTSASVELLLDGRSGPGCVLIDVDLASTGVSMTLDLLHAEESPPVRTREPEVHAETPDIVLIVLDAARADNVGAYGYSRQTSPNIDRLAAESLLFENVYATAPYTLSSMATMLTGLSFVQHGVTVREHRLSESVTTLAEYLQEAGYRTACLSANPNNSARLGLEQGCDVFEEFWQDVVPPASLDPYRVSRRALDVIGDAAESPLFLMLHYVPPHEPYAPRSEFDIFGDEGYDGGYDGSLETIRAIDNGTLEPTPADLAEIVSLYDGNLRTGDDAVGLVLDMLQRRERWDQTVVLVTSDHGEAFGEHGRMGHNTTVYDEMLHVPFVLRVPEDFRLPAVDSESIASLADVTPTLLGLAGVEPRGRLYGQNLLAPRVTAGRHVVSRSGGVRPFYAYRTERWKAIQGRGKGELYDLSVDPDERRDLYVENPATFACLDALLQLEVSGSGEASTETEGRELSEEELRALRSLGYVR